MVVWCTGALALILDPASVVPPSNSYLSAGGVVYLLFDEVGHFVALLVADIDFPVCRSQRIHCTSLCSWPALPDR